MPRFVDTNVLMYAVSGSADELPKRERARAILREPELAVSTQVLQEFYVQATRATRTDRIGHDAASRLIAALERYPVQETTFGLVLAALETRERYGLSYWDAAIVAAAQALGCRELLSEDLGAGQRYGDVVVVNPFVERSSGA